MRSVLSLLNNLVEALIVVTSVKLVVLVKVLSQWILLLILNVQLHLWSDK